MIDETPRNDEADYDPEQDPDTDAPETPQDDPTTDDQAEGEE
ncbi:hypothetical protein [Solirubrobacter deserti]|uniref:Uncharacterized protein n=1 Tax=Solirubrobacter deserti TaxID=2282478 RepID=A0ABT4RGS4_9ACTN|nr:hypothetical protein [Solirubrobacter deserti]MDA0137717.1 hypothetical protein [Solirubrobacter deserti]